METFNVEKRYGTSSSRRANQDDLGILERTTDQPIVLCVNWSRSGLDSQCILDLCAKVEYVSSADLSKTSSRNYAAILVYIDHLDHPACWEIERLRHPRLLLLTKAVDTATALWALRVGVTDLISIPQELPYLMTRLDSLLLEYASNQPANVAYRSTRVNAETLGRIHFALQVIEQRFNEHLTVPYLASLCNLSSITFLRHFKREVGSTVIAYLNRYRINRSKKRLTETTIPIKVIASECGFEDVAYFSRVFQIQVGMSPSKFRQQVKKKREVISMYRGDCNI